MSGDLYPKDLRYIYLVFFLRQLRLVFNLQQSHTLASIMLGFKRVSSCSDIVLGGMNEESMEHRKGHFTFSMMFFSTLLNIEPSHPRTIIAIVNSPNFNNSRLLNHNWRVCFDNSPLV